MSDERELHSNNGICFPCEVYAGGPEPSACNRGGEYLSTEEEEILRSLKELKEKARFLRGQIRALEFACEMGQVGEEERSKFSAQLDSAMAEMQELRKAWAEAEARLKKANARKLALLGHGPWDDANPASL